MNVLNVPRPTYYRTSAPRSDPPCTQQSGARPFPWGNSTPPPGRGAASCHTAAPPRRGRHRRAAPPSRSHPGPTPRRALASPAPSTALPRLRPFPPPPRACPSWCRRWRRSWCPWVAFVAGAPPAGAGSGPPLCLPFLMDFPPLPPCPPPPPGQRDDAFCISRGRSSSQPLSPPAPAVVLPPTAPGGWARPCSRRGTVGLRVVPVPAARKPTALCH